MPDNQPTPKKENKALQADVDTYGPVLAILTSIGGWDTRPRLGGLVHHEELGPGTVVKIETKSKVVVLFHGRKAVKSCHIGAVKALPVLGFRVDQLPMSETVMGVWTSLVRLSGPGGRVAAAAMATPPSSGASNIQSLTSTRPVIKFPSDGSSLDVPLLRQQQIRLGLLKAAHVLFSQQENLRQIMSRTGDSEDGGHFSLFQQLLSAATRPSPIKAMFTRNELEAAAVSVCQYLASEVHKPLTPPQTTPTPSLPISGGSKSKPKKNHSSGVAPPSQPSTNKATATSKTRVKPAPELPPPSPLVSQIMEMGFPRHHIEKAIEVTRGTSSAERLIAWLLDPTNQEYIQQADQSQSGEASSTEADSSEAGREEGGGEAGRGRDKNREKGREGGRRGGKGISSSESSDVSDDDIEVPDELLVPEPGQKPYKTAKDFGSAEDYARYVRDNVRVGMLVKCKDDYEEVKSGDIGRVTKLDNDGLNDLNIQCMWQGKGVPYWVRFANVEILGNAHSPTAPSEPFKPGDKVRVKRSVHTPKYKWGSISHQSVGVVQTLNRNGIDVTVNFPEQANWTGVISEMELVPGSHPRHSCSGCKISPIDGPRYHCQVCSDFDFCQSCFDKGQSHNHVFERIDDQGQPAVYVGSPHSRRKALRRHRKKAMRGGSVVMDWDQIVKHLTISSNESQAYRLIDSSHSTFWQSSGPQGK
ncbi:E3 ubiquitin-protein ligase HERC2, partial [Geodia barretti]